MSAKACTRGPRPRQGLLAGGLLAGACLAADGLPNRAFALGSPVGAPRSARHATGAVAGQPAVLAGAAQAAQARAAAAASTVAGVGLGLAAALRGGPRRSKLRGATARRIGVGEVPTTPPCAPGPKMRVIVFGATGYIGKATVTELAARGHSVIAVARKDSGIGGKQSLDEVQAAYAELGDVEVVAGDVMDEASVMGIMESTKPDAAVCCLASRMGGRQDAYDIDYGATMNTHKAARACKLRHFVMLSAVCVQRPLLAIQEAKLKAEAEIREGGDELPYSIVQPTAFFKSLLGQLAGVKGGRPYVMFGDGTQVRCKPISEEDLAGFISDCLWDEKKRNRTLPIGGPGPALCFREIGEEIHRNLGREPKFLFIPFSIFDIIQAPLDFLTGLLPEQLADAAEYGRIGRYYAEQSMLVLNKETDTYAPELTPSYGKTSLPEFLRLALEPGSDVLEKQKMGVPQASNMLSMLVGLSDLQKSLGLAPAPPAPAPVEVEEVAKEKEKEKEKEFQLEEA